MTEVEPLQKLHLLPFAEGETKLEGRSRIDFISPVLRRKRTAKEVLRTGDVLSHEDVEFAIIKCEPPEGLLGMDTDFFTEGSPVVRFEKIQFSAWGPTEMTSEMLFKEYLQGHFKGDYSPYGSAKAKCVHLFHCTQVFEIDGVQFQVEATEPPGMGVVTADTVIFAEWAPEFERVHIVPFGDTLPRAYAFDIFQDYLKPFLQRNQHKKFQAHEFFMYHGVQFKVVACEPNTPSRVGKNTTIFCEGVLDPSVRNLLPPNLHHAVAELPPGLQMLLLNTEQTNRELEEMLTQRRGLFDETLCEITRLEWSPTSSDHSQQTCMICLGDFRRGDRCARLPCRHIYHSSCIDEWLRRCTDCPICKDNVDRAIRQY